MKPFSAMSAATAVVGALGLSAYWRHMSPHSQALGAFPFNAGPGTSARHERAVALTFDDGPNEPYTSRIAAILESRDVRGTFFQVGRCVERHPGTTLALAEAGHVVGNHSYSHRFDRVWTPADVRDEVSRSQQVLTDVLGRRPALYRPPWLARTRSTFDVLEEHRLRPVSGEFCHAWEPLQPAATRIARRALAKVRPGSILIFHDGYDAQGARRDNTVTAVETVVDTLLRQGYALVPLDRLLGVPAYQ